MRFCRVLSIFIYLFATQTFANHANNVTVKQLMLDRGHGLILFVDLSAGQTKLTCHQNGTWEYALSLSDDIGKQLYSMLLSAKISGKSIDVAGNNQCDVFSNIETLNRVELNN